ncbi:MAG: diacylglycerol kinase [Peptoniphilaceae bacterium]|nr:diacylglycerol kinase [Peptoniphilaceae bacterium]MDD7383517.1 diacylglycerol kinase [Peptoniphilaceae bacterium]MDY3738690.1 diacylglycerol kinase [Peptoniphilaceae bacterium]
MSDNKKDGEKYNPKEGKTLAERFVKGFDYAFDGIIFAIKSEKNVKFHIISSVLILMFSLFMNISRVEMILVVFAVSFVLVTELLNTAIEQAVNLASDQNYSIFAKNAKDVAAGATLVASFCALFVGYLVFFDKVVNISDSVFLKIRKNPEHLTIITVVIVVILTIFLKGIFYDHGSAFHGGAVSGHTSVAFCFATIGALFAHNSKVALILYILATIVAESRFEADIHSIKEILAGAMLGTLIAIFIFGVIG